MSDFSAIDDVRRVSNEFQVATAITINISG